MTTTYDPPTTNDPNATRQSPATNDPDPTSYAPRSAEQTTINAWSSSPLGEPSAETMYPFDGVALSAFDEPPIAPNGDVRAAKPSRGSWGLVLAAVLIGAVGVGTALGMFIFDTGDAGQHAPVNVVPGSNSAPIASQTPAVVPQPTIAPAAPQASSVPSSNPAPAVVSAPDNGQGTQGSPGDGSGTPPSNGPAPTDTGTAPTDTAPPSDPAPDPGSGSAPVNPPSGPTVVIMPPPVWLPSPPLPSQPTPTSNPTPPTQTPPTQTPQTSKPPVPPIVHCQNPGGKCFVPKI